MTLYMRHATLHIAAPGIVADAIIDDAHFHAAAANTGRHGARVGAAGNA